METRATSPTARHCKMQGQERQGDQRPGDDEREALNHRWPARWSSRDGSPSCRSRRPAGPVRAPGAPPRRRASPAACSHPAASPRHTAAATGHDGDVDQRLVVGASTVRRVVDDAAAGRRPPGTCDALAGWRSAARDDLQPLVRRIEEAGPSRGSMPRGTSAVRRPRVPAVRSDLGEGDLLLSQPHRIDLDLQRRSRSPRMARWRRARRSIPVCRPAGQDARSSRGSWSKREGPGRTTRLVEPTGCSVVGGSRTDRQRHARASGRSGDELACLGAGRCPAQALSRSTRRGHGL